MRRAIQIITGMTGIACVMMLMCAWIVPAGAARKAWIASFTACALPMLCVSTAIGITP